MILGVLLIVFGVYLWIKAVVLDKIDNNIKINKLVTTGAYAWVRNPIYSAFMLICTGVILIIGNLFFFILPLLFWAFLTILMKQTEEKWLLDLYGEDYREYCRKVNRCIPWFPKKK
ncbi:MAG: isoprenylcysteine carboxylmethyltransferase family protein [Bacteroidales bacterium]|nr:isoprenylcysteine carboxylmethyltransferase family protein [Bacteroidales bacterium]